MAAAISASLVPPGIVVPTMPNPPSSERRRIGDLVRVDGHDVHVRHDGPEHASAVVLVHGFACSMHWFDRVAAELTAEHRVIRVDLLGHGCTSAATSLDATAQARAMSAVLEQLGTNGATAVGHSFGADVVLAMARRSDQVARVVIIAQAPDYDCSRLPAIAYWPSAGFTEEAGSDRAPLEAQNGSEQASRPNATYDASATVRPIPHIDDRGRPSRPRSSWMFDSSRREPRWALPQPSSSPAQRRSAHLPPASRWP
jgi:pimeloyl-ACP methyl ester carboxylesterase